VIDYLFTIAHRESFTVLTRKRIGALLTMDDEPAIDRVATAVSRRAFPPLAALRAFDALVRLGGVRRAAEALSVDHAAISRHIKALETWTGTQLISRAGNRMELTDAGRRYYAEIAKPLEAIASATMSLMHSPKDDRLHIWCVPGFASQWLMPRLESFYDAHPGMEIELRPTEDCPDFGQHEADVQILYMPDYGSSAPFVAGTHVQPFGNAPVFPVASPDYLRKLAPIRTLRDLLDHSLIQERDSANWGSWFAKQGVTPLAEIHGPRLWHGPSYSRCSKAGLRHRTG
jgi:DNA-binding transcriptional LysR family regulator